MVINRRFHTHFSAMLLVVCAMLLIGCDVTRQQMAQIGKAPPMTDVTPPIEKSSYKPLKWPKEEARPSLANSLWQPGSRTFFRDHRARRIGDILTVVIEIDDKAKLDNKTQRDRDTDRSLKAPNVFGFEKELTRKLLPNGADPDSLLSIGGKVGNKGTGVIDRKEKINTEIAAMVTQILPNGNLVISGSQEIRVNFEVREVSIEGIVRPQDIGADNTIKSTQIAEARVSYGGRGQMTDVQQPSVGSQLIDIISPF